MKIYPLQLPRRYNVQQQQDENVKIKFFAFSISYSLSREKSSNFFENDLRFRLHNFVVFATIAHIASILLKVGHAIKKMIFSLIQQMFCSEAQ